MAARKIFSNFELNFGGVQRYNQRSRMEMVVVKMELKCKNQNAYDLTYATMSPLC
jgi:hypothetical protein